jgi:hypothetical protein
MLKYEAELMTYWFSLLNHSVLCNSRWASGEQMDELDLMDGNGHWSSTIVGPFLSYNLVNHLSEFRDQQTTGLWSPN